VVRFAVMDDLRVGTYADQAQLEQLADTPLGGQER
jgi:hypothetical protein